MSKKKLIQKVLVIGNDLTDKAALGFAQLVDNLPVHQLDCLALSLAQVKAIDSTGLAILISSQPKLAMVFMLVSRTVIPATNAWVNALFTMVLPNICPSA